MNLKIYVIDIRHFAELAEAFKGGRQQITSKDLLYLLKLNLRKRRIIKE